MNPKDTLIIFMGLMLTRSVLAAPTSDVSIRGAFDFLIKLLGGLTLQGLDSIELVVIFAAAFIVAVLAVAVLLGLLWVGKKILKGVVA